MVMRLRTGAPRWFNEDHPELQAKCVSFPGTRRYDPWFGTEKSSDDNDGNFELTELEEAKKICNGVYDHKPCPLLAQCLEFAVVNNEKHGVWGGTTPEERKTIRQQRRSKWQQAREAGEEVSPQGDWRIMQAPVDPLSC